ncbi:hypothetical protein H671_6g16684 [Cricetulus griseus]|nr:hypothetical protein H671_6g16684 [Cricetulus griseus]
MVQVFHILVSVTPKYFMLFVANVKGDVSLISFSTNVSSIYDFKDNIEESGKPCLVPDFRGIGSSFSPFNLILAVSLLYIAFIMLRILLRIFASMFMRDIGL